MQGKEQKMGKNKKKTIFFLKRLEAICDAFMCHREVTTEDSGLKHEISKFYKFRNDLDQVWLDKMISSAAGTSKSTKTGIWPQS